METTQKETQTTLNSFFGAIATIRSELDLFEDEKSELNDKIKRTKKELEKAIKAGIQAAGY